MINFASDNCAPVHPKIFESMLEVNKQSGDSYGEDSYTIKARQVFKDIFGQDTRTFFVLNGTGANVLSFKALCQPYHSILCSDEAHLANEESGAPNSACNVQPISTEDGKLTPDLIAPYLEVLGFVHTAQPKIVSISQATEREKVYTLDEIKAIAQIAHQHGLLLHMDGARVANAAVQLNVTLKEITQGVDILSFGGSKNGLMIGEAVVIINPNIAEDFKFYIKSNMQLVSKLRYISNAFIAYFQEDLWKTMAQHANDMASYLYQSLKPLSQIVITDVGCNSVFVNIPRSVIEPLQKEFMFYIWKDASNSNQPQIRLMTSFDTLSAHVDQFCHRLQDCLAH